MTQRADPRHRDQRRRRPISDEAAGGKTGGDGHQHAARDGVGADFMPAQVAIPAERHQHGIGVGGERAEDGRHLAEPPRYRRPVEDGREGVSERRV